MVNKNKRVFIGHKVGYTSFLNQCDYVKNLCFGSVNNTLINTEDLIVSRVILRLFQGIRSIMTYLERSYLEAFYLKCL